MSLSLKSLIIEIPIVFAFPPLRASEVGSDFPGPPPSDRGRADREILGLKAPRAPPSGYRKVPEHMSVARRQLAF